MDYKKLEKELPGLYQNWGEDTIRPRSQRFHQVKQQVKGMTTVSVMQLLNFAVECMEPSEMYCEIGTYLGATLIGALIDRPEVRAYSVDNFSKFDPEGKNFNILSENLSKFGLSDRVTFHNQDMQEFFIKLRNRQKKPPKIGVYFYDGSHDYKSQLLALLYVKRFLAKQALIVVDDSNSPRVKEANWHFIATHPQCRMLFDFPTPKNGYHTFWNGIQVLSWDVTRKKNYSWSGLKEYLTK